jgi:hypothetical protein
MNAKRGPKSRETGLPETGNRSKNPSSEGRTFRAQCNTQDFMAAKPRNEQARERTIEAWMLTIVQDGGIARFDDLHIDRIDDQWKQREMWIQGGLEAFRLALMVRDRHQLPFTVGLGFSLDSEKQLAGVEFQTADEFIARVDWSPPSLYLFEPGTEPSSQTTALRNLSRNLFPGLPETTSCYCIEFREKDTNEHRRSVFLEG